MCIQSQRKVSDGCKCRSPGRPCWGKLCAPHIPYTSPRRRGSEGIGKQGRGKRKEMDGRDGRKQTEILVTVLFLPITSDYSTSVCKPNTCNLEWCCKVIEFQDDYTGEAFFVPCRTTQSVGINITWSRSIGQQFTAI